MNFKPAGAENILEAVRRIYPTLSKGQKRIADCILENWESIAFISPKELGQRIGVSEATVIRFAQSLGYPSFSELRRICRDLIQERLTPAEKLAATVRRFDSGGQTIPQALLTSEVENLKAGISRVDAEALRRAAGLIGEAGRVFLLGQGVSVSLCHFLAFRFRRMQIDARLLTHGGKEFYEQLMLLRPGDVVLGVGFFRCAREIVKGFAYARKLGVPTIAVTHSAVSELALKAEVVLVANRGPVSLLNSLVVPMAILNVLVVCVAEGSGERLRALQELDRIPEIFGNNEGKPADNPGPSNLP